MNELVLVDTDVLIDAGREIVDATNCLQQIESRSTLAISVITHMELLVGCRNITELRELDQFLLRFQIVSLNEHISERAVNVLRRYRLSHGLLIPDALIAATAIFFDVSFATKNQRHFRFIEGLKLLPYPQPFSPVEDNEESAIGEEESLESEM